MHNDLFVFQIALVKIAKGITTQESNDVSKTS